MQVAGDHSWASVSVGYSHACGIDTAGAGWCWGDNTPGQLGDGTAINTRNTPVRVTVAGAWRSLEAGFQHTCGVTTAGVGWCWGWNDDGPDLDLDELLAPAPKAHRLSGTWADLTAGWAFTVGANSGVAWGWGQGDYGQTGFGVGADRLTPRKVAINP